MRKDRLEEHEVEELAEAFRVEGRGSEMCGGGELAKIPGLWGGFWMGKTQGDEKRVEQSARRDGVFVPGEARQEEHWCGD